jgi:hypothetical protein
MSQTIDDLANYNPADYPQLPNAEAQFFTKEFRKLRNAINSIEAVMKAGGLGVTVVASTPTGSNLPVGATGVFKVTAGGAVYLAYNDAGTIKKVALI